MSEACSQSSPLRDPLSIFRAILCIIERFAAGTLSMPVTVTPPEPVIQTVSITTMSASGTVAAGATSLEFHPSSDFVGTIAGVSYPGATWAIVGPIVASSGNKLGAVSITRSAGSINVLKVV